MSQVGFQHTRNLSGTTICTGTCPGSPVFHVGNVQAGWTVKGVTTYGSTATSGHVLPAAYINVNATANLDNPFPCFIDSAACSATGSEEVSCSQEGQLVNETGGPGPGFQLNLATSRFLVDPAREVHIMSTRTRYYMQGSWCWNTAFPDFNPSMLPGPPPQTYTYLPFRTGFDLSLMMMNFSGTGWVPLPAMQPIYKADFLQPQNQIPEGYCTKDGQ